MLQNCTVNVCECLLLMSVSCIYEMLFKGFKCVFDYLRFNYVSVTTSLEGFTVSLKEVLLCAYFIDYVLGNEFLMCVSLIFTFCIFLI